METVNVNKKDLEKLWSIANIFMAESKDGAIQKLELGYRLGLVTKDELNQFNRLSNIK